MSSKGYSELLNATQLELHELVLKETQTGKAKSEKVRSIAYRALRISYVKYIHISSRLEACYDQVIQPQKRQVIRKLLDGTNGRILELRHEMVEFNYSEVHPMDDVLMDLKLTPDDIEIPIPRYFTIDRQVELKSRRDQMDEIISKYNLGDENNLAAILTVDKAVLVIQIMERARQGRLRAKFMKEIYLKQQRDKLRTGKDSSTGMDPHVAALKIQRIWRGYSTWKRIQKEKESEMIFLGMIPLPKASNEADPIALFRSMEADRKLKQAQMESRYQTALINIKKLVAKKESHGMIETMKAEVRNWFTTTREETGKYPDYPTDEDGGYQAVILKSQQEAERLLLESKSKKKAKPGQGSKKFKFQQEEDEGYIPKSSVFLPDLGNTINLYKENWGTEEDFDERDKYNEDLIRSEKRKDVAQEIRVQVDALMREELERLKIALMRDEGKKGKHLKRKHKAKQTKKKKKRREKDLTSSRKLDELYDELVREEIIVRYPKVNLSQFIGGYFTVTCRGDAKGPPLPSLADVRRMIAEYCILPLGSPEVHKNAPFIRSLLLCGPTKTGKTMLTHAICTETGATLFNLTATNLAGKYPGREGLRMLMHLINKVGRLLQPSVILIDDVDKVFLKKVSKADKTDPKRIKKDLTKLLKGISADDRIIIIGTSNSPFECDAKGLMTTFPKIILILRPDYSSRFCLWQRSIEDKGGIINRSFNLSFLASVSDGYTAGAICEAISQVLTRHRIAIQKRKALQSLEFIRPLAMIEPIYREEDESYLNWYKKTPIERQRIALAEEKGQKRKTTKVSADKPDSAKTSKAPKK